MTRMMTTLTRAALVAGLAVPMSVVPLMADDAADQAAIQALWDQYEALVVAGDGETWIGLYDTAGIQMPPGAPMNDYAAVVADAKTWSPGDIDAMSITPMETVILGDMAWSMGTYTMDFPTDDGPGHLDGKFMTLLKRQDDGSWAIYRDIYNADN